jgi:hypothetical protein
MAKKKTWITVAVVAVILASVGFMYLSFHPSKPPDVFAGFKLMDVPRADVKIGSLWQQDVGPIRPPKAIPQLQTRSLSESEMKGASKYNATIAGNLANRISATVTGSADLAQTIKVKRMSVATVADASTLETLAGNAYIWEAIRVDQFSITVSKARAAEIHAKAKDVTEADSISEEVTGSDSVELTATGTKLFIAYRVVTIAQPTLQNVATVAVAESVSDINVGSDYAIHFQAVRANDSIFNPNCSVVMKIRSYRQLNADGSPVERTEKIKCGLIADGNYPANSTTGTDRAIIDTVRVNDLRVKPDSGLVAKASGSFAIERRNIILQAITYPRAPGW